MNPSITTQDSKQPAYGFTVTAGNLVIRLGHKVQGPTVTLFATTQIADNAPMMWRQFETPRHSAVDAAEMLADDAMEYAESTGGVIRPSEDLDIDDFLHHLHLTIQGELN